MWRHPALLIAVTVVALQAVPFAKAQTAAPAPPAEQTAPAQPDAFGVEVELPEKTIIYFKGTGNWDAAFETIVEGFKTVNGLLEKRGIKAAGPMITIYTATDDTGFSFQAAVPVDAAPEDPPQGDIAVGKSPAGKALKFTHRGSYDSMDTTYEAITNFLDEKQLDAKDLFIEEYRTNPITTPEDKLVIDVYVPIR